MEAPVYSVRTERLLVRGYEPSDAVASGELLKANLEHLRWMPWATTEATTVESRLGWIRRVRAELDRGGSDLVYGIFDASGRELMGGIGLHARIGPHALEIGYWISAAHEGRGYVTEAAGALTRVAFDVHHVGRVEIHCDPRNTRSAAVARRLGYTHDATLRRRTLDPEGRERDTMVWSLFADELRRSAASKVGYEAFDALERSVARG
ncbi:GNAT family N-acetyltransferase [Sandaracinus amylolyticus]|uniref:GNAT family N-acetyltransferase n=1 Tax=Sandaracinus amylolyticus TaxID=927083 RepID=UPI001F283C2E|nr:GNAT family protein [Sandaracinus amylolyticus]UJR81841.1 Ribosomal protein N-acetyltransferase [Sandaracinus amylolyticus]